MRITITQPDDWHLHVRDGDVLAAVLPHTARRFARAIIMPNLVPPVTTTVMAQAYRARILAALPPGSRFEPLMTLYLTDHTSPREIERAKDSQIVHGVKLYPAGATTHAEVGVTAIEKVYPALEAMQDLAMVLQVHGEVVDSRIDIFEREQVFVEQVLSMLHARFPALKFVLEHVTSRRAVEFVRAAGPLVAATITPQHLLYNRNALFDGGLRPHHYCLPVLKRERDRLAVVEAATSGDARFFLGTDSAPHTRKAKECAHGCAGVFSAHAAIELYAQVFEAAGALDKLEAFASRNGPRFYELPVNTSSITLARVDWTVPTQYPLGDESVVGLGAGQTLQWRLLG